MGIHRENIGFSILCLCLGFFCGRIRYNQPLQFSLPVELFVNFSQNVLVFLTKYYEVSTGAQSIRNVSIRYLNRTGVCLLFAVLMIIYGERRKEMMRDEMMVMKRRR